MNAKALFQGIKTKGVRMREKKRSAIPKVSRHKFPFIGRLKPVGRKNGEQFQAPLFYVPLKTQASV